MGIVTNYQEILELPYCKDLLNYEWNGLPLFDLILLIPTLIFLLFLLWNLKKSLRKLKESESMIISTYYKFIWIVCVFNIVKCLIIITTLQTPFIFDFLYLISNSLLIFLEISVVVLMSYGYMVTGREAMQHTAFISFIVTLFYFTIQCIAKYIFEVPLFNMTTTSALFWFIIGSIFMISYATVMILPSTCLKDKLPARPSYYHYVGFLLSLYSIRTLGSALIFFGANIGFCLVDIQMLIYYSLFAPVLYICFMRDFFKDIFLPDYFVEMRKSGFFDSDT